MSAIPLVVVAASLASHESWHFGGTISLPRLGELAQLLPSAELIGDSVALEDLTLDSRDVRPGSLFCATRGTRFDGHTFIDDAVSAGAAAVMVAHPVEVDVPQLVVPSVRHAIGRVASYFFGDPSKQLEVVGITGTNGKTTTSYLVESVLNRSKRNVGLIGTIESRFAGLNRPSIHTTPEAPDLHRLLADMLHDGTQSVVMEVSSHGIDQHRIDSMHFEVAVFTNLSPEHLDYHGTMEQYFYTKARLFVPTLTNTAVIGTDTEWGRRLASQVSVDHVTYGPGPENDFVVSNIELVEAGTRFRLAHAGHSAELTVPILGAHNAYNGAAAAAVGFVLGIDRDEVFAGIEHCHSVAGRFESIMLGQDFRVVVDYAHTPDAIRSLIETVRLQSPSGRVILVAGARGRRDRLKRPELGRAAAMSDLAILTADNPGDEEPAEIVAQLLAGTLDVATPRMVVELDRRRAITLAINEAGVGDTVLIVGRGHEQSLRVGSAVVYLDDREVARSAVATRLGTQTRLR